MKEEEITRTEASFLGGTKLERGRHTGSPSDSYLVSLFSKDMRSAALHLGLAPIHRGLNEGWGLPFIVLPRWLSRSRLHSTQGGRCRNFHAKAGHVA